MVSAVKKRPCGQRSISSSLLPLVLVFEKKKNGTTHGARARDNNCWTIAR